jgi:hypothetical protein
MEHFGYCGPLYTKVLSHTLSCLVLKSDVLIQTLGRHIDCRPVYGL